MTDWNEEEKQDSACRGGFRTVHSGAMDDWQLDHIIDAHSENPIRKKVYSTCPRCERRMLLRRVPSMTRYEWDGQGDNPNADWFLCEECSDDYTQFMIEQWQEYYNGIL